jgi:hypothetical protein
MKFVFMPISVLGGLVAGMIGRKIFEQLWGMVDDVEPPKPKHREIEWPKLIVALIVEGAIFRLIRGLFDRGSRRGFAAVTGTWPGEEAPEPE